ncbi:HEMGN protein, partial [Rhinopomastus cyanomelas]|nr:HEMGN protein [Rhinopomastus cyanomelas]
ITHRLRDRELLRKRKAEAQEKDSIQWVLREQEKNKRQRRGRGRGGRRGRGHQLVVEPSLEPEPEPNLQPDSRKKADPAPAEAAPTEPALAETALPELVNQEEPPMLTIQDLVSGMQPGVVEGQLAAKSQDPTGEEEVLKPEADIPEALTTPLEYDHQDSEYHTHVLF